MRVIFISVLLLSACMASGQINEKLVVYFDFDKHILTQRARQQVDSFMTVNRFSGSVQIELSGHCDFKGSDAYNDALSRRRVKQVEKLLKTYLPADSFYTIKAVAYGEKKPVNENRTSEERQLNRRVEIIIKALHNAEYGIVEDVPAAPLKNRIADTATVAGTNIILRNINFYGGMHRLMPESAPILQELLDAMKTYPKLVIEIQGHICCESRPGDGRDLETGIYNLSYARAKAIYDYLVASGIEPDRLSYRGFGHSQPIYPYPEQSEHEKVANRRVEIKIISK